MAWVRGYREIETEFGTSSSLKSLSDNDISFGHVNISVTWLFSWKY